jgi:hypothetical protein
MKQTKEHTTHMTPATTQPLNELVEKLRALTPRGMSHQPARRHWFAAAQLMNNSAQHFASEAKFRNGQWILIGRWREHEAGMARALRDLAMAKQIAIGIRFSLLEEEESHFFKLALRAIDELQRHPRFACLPTHTPATEIQPA